MVTSVRATAPYVALSEAVTSKSNVSMARLAANKLIASIEGRQDEARTGVFLDPELVIRDSTRSLEPTIQSIEGGQLVEA